jgi:hypothetical protein
MRRLIWMASAGIAIVVSGVAWLRLRDFLDARNDVTACINLGQHDRLACWRAGQRERDAGRLRAAADYLLTACGNTGAEDRIEEACDTIDNLIEHLIDVRSCTLRADLDPDPPGLELFVDQGEATGTSSRIHIEQFNRHMHICFLTVGQPIPKGFKRGVVDPPIAAGPSVKTVRSAPETASSNSLDVLQ